MNTFKPLGMPASPRVRAALQAAMYAARKRNRRAQAAALGDDRVRQPIDNTIDQEIDNPDPGTE